MLKKIAKESGGLFLNLANNKNLRETAKNIVNPVKYVEKVEFEERKKYDEDFIAYNSRKQLEMEILPKQPINISKSFVVLTGKVEYTDRGLSQEFSHSDEL